MAALDKGERAVLVALRDKLAQAIDAEPAPRDMVSLTRRFLQITADLAALDSAAAAAGSGHVGGGVGLSEPWRPEDGL
ncbi:hypothetical protein A5641_12205 [Mycobacterium sp. 1554424.7]|nr:hypothetical protein A5641_12205 [Mycobacterium sp. 1554424.7]